MIIIAMLRILKVGMTIYAQPVGTRLGSTLRGRVLPYLIKNWVKFGFFKNKNKN